MADKTINAATGKEFTGGDVMTIFFSVLTGAFAVGAAAPGFAAANAAKLAGFRIFSVIERVPAIDSAADGGQTLPALKGEIVFEDVEFAYPTR